MNSAALTKTGPGEPSHPPPEPAPLRVLVSGSHGLIGYGLVRPLTGQGHDVIRLVRDRNTPSDGIRWEPRWRRLPKVRLEGFDAIVHLAGENIASHRLTEYQKSEIRDSRMDGARLMRSKLSELSAPSKVFVGAAVVGVYGNRGDEILAEESSLGEVFQRRAWPT